MPTLLYFFLGCTPMPVMLSWSDDVFLDERHWLRFSDSKRVKAEYFRPEIAKDAAENEGTGANRERVVVLGKCLDQLKKYGF
ncbi:hypothetical protein SB861_49160 [Paraburkholderia sp. SIMBA_049]